jgi:hypothetical protein
VIIFDTGAVNLVTNPKMDPSGFEPEASPLQRERSTVELRARALETFSSAREPRSRLCKNKQSTFSSFLFPLGKKKGGDPSAGSPTDTL